MKRLPIGQRRKRKIQKGILGLTGIDILASTLLLIGLSIIWSDRPKPQMMVPYNDPYKYHSEPIHPGGIGVPPPAQAENPKTASMDAHDVMQFAVSIILL